MEIYDTIVIGAGIAGASAAYEMAAYGTALLLERETVAGYHTTGRSAALFTVAHERGPVRSLTAAAREFFEHPPEGFVETPLLSPLPVLFVGTEDQRARVEQLVAGDELLLPVDATRMREMCPALGEVIVAGALEPASSEIDVHALHQGFLRGARRRGATVRLGTPAERITATGTHWEVVAAGERFAGEVVVDAAGAWGDEVARLAGVRPVGLQPMRRTAFTFEPEGYDLAGWPMVVDVDEQFYFKPERTRLMGSLAEETPMPPCDVRPEEVDVALAIERITAVTTFRIRHVPRTWAGLRTFAPDRLPVVGFDDDVPGFLWLVGQGGFGIQTAPTMAALAAALRAGAPIPDHLLAAGLDPTALSPGRFSR